MLSTFQIQSSNTTSSSDSEISGTTYTCKYKEEVLSFGFPSSTSAASLVCNQTYPSEYELKCHSLTHQKSNFNIFKCTECEYESTIKHSVTRHMIGHFGSGEIPKKNFRCIHCDAFFPRKFKLQKHLILIHEIELLGNEFMHPRIQNGKKNGTNIPHILKNSNIKTEPEINVCGFNDVGDGDGDAEDSESGITMVYESNSNAKKSKLTETFEEEASNCETESPTTTTIAAEIVSYKCEICDSSFQDITLRDRHEAFHYIKQDFHCAFCKAYFGTEDLLFQHLDQHELFKLVVGNQVEKVAGGGGDSEEEDSQEEKPSAN